MSQHFQTEAEYYAWAQQLTAALKAAEKAPAAMGVSTSTLEQKDLKAGELRHSAPRRIQAFRRKR